MCGILVHIGKTPLPADHSALEIIKHRGPDGFGAKSFALGGNRHLTLGHRRLAIIDLSERGAQPMSFDDENFWISYNGEVYNYLEIRSELEAAGVSFHSDSDTEVILAAFAKWGIRAFHRFNGMFAFCIYDRQKNRLTFCRDRFGIKPLYIYNSTEACSFASEIKQFTEIAGFRPEIHQQQLYHFLNFGESSFSNGTMWRGVECLMPGHYLEINLDQWLPGRSLNPSPWYELNVERNHQIRYEEAVEQYRGLLQDSVRLRLRADVPLGFLLSGGIDSSTLVGLASGLPREDHAALKTFSSCYQDSPVDESHFVKDMLAHCGAESSLHYPQAEEVGTFLDKVIWHNDIPIRYGSPVPHWLLYKHVREDNDNRIVIIEGQGGDEFLCGYGDFHWAFLAELFGTGHPLKFLSQAYSFQRVQHNPWKVILRKIRRIGFPGSVPIPLAEGLRYQALIGDKPLPIPIPREADRVDKLHQARLRILRYILHNVDRNSMAHSRETRVPFLDYRLAEFCMSLPPEFKISAGYTKRVLRDAISGVVPENIRMRSDKQGYSSPMSDWIKGPLAGFFSEALAEAAEQPFADAENVLREFRRFQAGQRAWNPFWWYLVCADRWLKVFKLSI